MKKKHIRLNEWNEEKKALSDIWEENISSFRKSRFEKGDVVIVDFGENVGSEYNSEIQVGRPALVVSNGSFNHGILIVAPMTGANFARECRRFEYKLNFNKYSFLHKSSTIQLNALKTLSVVRVKNKIGKLNDQDLKNIDRKLISILSIKI